MKKVRLIIIFFVFTISLFCISNVFAVDMFLTNETEGEILEDTSEESSNIPLSSYNTINTNTESSTSNNNYSSSTVNYLNNDEEEGLSVSDIINIILISVCIVQILLGIAILIRLK